LIAFAPRRLSSLGPRVNAAEAVTLVEEHLQFALLVAAKFGYRYPWLADCFESSAGYALWRCALRFTGEGSFRAMVRTAVIRDCIKRICHETRRNPVAFTRRPPIVGTDGELLDPLAIVPGREPEPDLPVVIADETAALPALLATLSPARQAAIVGVVMQDRTAADVARLLGVSRSRVGQLVASGLERLKAAAGG
jgi:RNA polymerase sigma factor (sigma-70 family)